MNRNSSNRGFTLLEMMIVVVIVVMLAGMVFRMIGAVGKNNDIADTRARLEMVANALEEFRAIYGKYPPVSVYDDAQPCGYEFPTMSTFGENPTTANNVAKQLVNGCKDLSWSGGKSSGKLYTFGLVSFFVPRYNGMADRGPLALMGVDESKHTQDSKNALAQWGNFNKKTSGSIGDSDRDLAAIRRILPHLNGYLGPDDRVHNDGIISWYYQERSISCPVMSATITNLVATIVDSWHNSLKYRSLPPYDTYQLWSMGPDEKDGTSDDIVVGRN